MRLLSSPRRLRTAAAVLACVAGAAVVTSRPAPAGPPGPGPASGSPEAVSAERPDGGDRGRRTAPAVAYATRDHVVVLDADGRVVRRVTRPAGGFALSGRVLATARTRDGQTRTVADDVVSGARRYAVQDTLLTPLLLRRGRVLVFAGQGERDRYATSLWVRGPEGSERRLVRFGFGGGPGVPTGISEGTVLDHSASADASTLAVAAGDDVVTFGYDVWVVGVRDGSVRRLTRGHRSRYPTVAPDGGRVAWFREEARCGGEMPGYRAGDLLVARPDGRARRVVFDGSCERYLTRPRWLSDDVVAGVLHTRRPGAGADPLYDSAVVLLDAGTGAVSAPLAGADRVGDVSVSPSTSRIAWNDWTRPDGFWLFTWAGGSDGRGAPSADGRAVHVDEGWAPHLEGDLTLVPSF